MKRQTKTETVSTISTVSTILKRIPYAHAHPLDMEGHALYVGDQVWGRWTAVVPRWYKPKNPNIAGTISAIDPSSEGPTVEVGFIVFTETDHIPLQSRALCYAQALIKVDGHVFPVHSKQRERAKR